MVHEITTSMRPIHSIPRVLTQLPDQFLESNDLVQGIAHLAVRKTALHLCDVRAGARLAVSEEGPTGVAFQPILPHGHDDSTNEEFPIRLSGKKSKVKKDQERRSSRAVRDTDTESDENQSTTGEMKSSTSEDGTVPSENASDRRILRITRPSNVMFKHTTDYRT